MKKSPERQIALSLYVQRILLMSEQGDYMVKHVVLFRVKPGTPDAAVGDVFAALGALTQTIPGLLECSGGVNNSAEGLAKKFTHGFVMTFEDVASRDAYLPHPDHELAKQKLLAIIDGGTNGVIVMDWSD